MTKFYENRKFQEKNIEDYYAILTSVAWILSVVIITVNSLTIHVIRKTPSLQTLSNKYIMSLAMANLLVGVAGIYYGFFFFPYFKHTFFDPYPRVCLFSVSFAMTSVLMSVLHLMIIAIDRCVCIKVPMFYYSHMDSKRVSIVILCIWIFGAIYTCVPQASFHEATHPRHCLVPYAMPIEFVVYFNAPLYFVSMIVTTAMYAVIMHTIASHRKHMTTIAAKSITQISLTSSNEMQTTSTIIWRYETSEDPVIGSFDVVAESYSREVVGGTRFPSTSVDTPSALVELLFRTMSAPHRILRVEESKVELHHHHTRFKEFNVLVATVTVFATIFGIYVLCISPCFIYMSLAYYMEIDVVVQYYLGLLAFSNSAANFFIFCYFSSAFRNALIGTCRYAARRMKCDFFSRTSSEA